MSSSADVHAALDRAFELLDEPDFRLNILVAHLHSLIRKSQYHATTEDKEAVSLTCQILAGQESVKDCLELLEDPNRKDPKLSNAFERRQSLYARIGKELAKNRALVLLRASPVHRIEQSCRVSRNSHADASVNRFAKGATLCVSVGNLRKLTRSVLLRETLGLLYHELAHLSGLGERQARIVQASFTDFYSRRFSMLKENLITQTNERLSSLNRDPLYLVEENFKTALLHYVFTIQTAPLVTDPLALQVLLELKSIRPALAYSYASIRFLAYYGWRFANPMKMQPEENETVVADLQKHFKQIVSNWIHISGQPSSDYDGQTFIAPSCAVLRDHVNVRVELNELVAWPPDRTGDREEITFPDCHF